METKEEKKILTKEKLERKKRRLSRKLLKEGHRSFQLFDPVVLCSMWNQRKDMLQNQLMFEGYYMQTFSQMEGKSHYNRWSSWSWLVLQKPSTIQIFKWQQGEWWAYRTADSCLESRVESLIQNSNSEFSVIILQMNEQDCILISCLYPWKTRIKLSLGWITKAREM